MLKKDKKDKESILDIIYYERDNALCELSIDEKRDNMYILKNNESNNQNLQIALNNLPDCFEEVSKNIKKCVEKKLESERELNGYYNKKYYKAGFSDAVQLIFEDIIKDKYNKR